MKPKLHIIIILLMVCSGCLSEKKIVKRYYTFEIPGSQLPGKLDSIPVIRGDCEIEQVEVAQAYEKNQIVNRVGSHEVSYFIYNQWAIRPADAIKEIILQYLQSAGLFQSTSARFSRIVPDYKFRTIIHKLELIENRKSDSAHLSLEFRIIDNSSDKIILNHKADRISPLKQKDLNLFALEVSSIFCQELSIFSGIIRDKRYLFTRNPR